MSLRFLGLALGFLAFGLGTLPSRACHDGSPLILDLNGDGLRTVDRDSPVLFDIDGDGHKELVTWTLWETEEGFLVLDRNRNGRIDSGREFFGDATQLPSGELASHGFQALAIFDQAPWGGDQDGVISAGDQIWHRLLVWVDRNHDGISQRSELGTLGHHGVLALDLEFVETDFIDGAGNAHRFKGNYLNRNSGNDTSQPELRALVDVFFRVASPTDH